MCLAFVLYYPRSPLADCRSLPTLNAMLKALGIEQVQGKSFQKLTSFLRDIGGNDSKS